MAGELTGPQQPYDAQVHNIHGQEVLLHEEAASMARALTQEQPASRVFSFYQDILFGATQNVSFVDTAGRVHGLSVALTSDNQKGVNATIWGAIKARGFQEADGTIKVDDKTGTVYQIYETEDPEDPEKLDAQMKAWTEDVNRVVDAHPGEGGFRYLESDEGTIIDFNRGAVHYVTVLRPESEYDIDYVRSEVPDVPMTDATPVVAWAQFLASNS